jgi:hypothetical protein
MARVPGNKNGGWRIRPGSGKVGLSLPRWTETWPTNHPRVDGQRVNGYQLYRAITLVTAG